jgi:hypothetical protein
MTQSKKEIRFLLPVDIRQRMVSYWTKLISGKQTKLGYITYRLMFHLFSVQNVNFQWLTYVNGIFDECGLTTIGLTTFIKKI